jgi:hypothetical protein
MLVYLGDELARLPPNAYGDSFVLHVGRTGPIGEAELKQQAITVQHAAEGVVNDSSDGDLLLALLMAMPEIARAGVLPPVVMRSTFYVAAAASAAAPAAYDEPGLLDDGDDDMLGPPGEPDMSKEPEVVRRAYEQFLTATEAPKPTPAPVPVPAHRMPTTPQASLTAYILAGQGAHAEVSVTTAAPAPAGAKRKMVREYVLVHELWKAMREAGGEHEPETFAYISLMMGSDLVPSVSGGAGSTIPRIGGKLAWDAWEEIAPQYTALVTQVPAAGDGTAAESSDLVETARIPAAFDYRVDWLAFVAWMRAAYAKKHAAKLRFSVNSDGKFVLPTWTALTTATDDAAGTKRVVLDLQWALQVGRQALYATHYYGMGIGSRNPLAKDDEGLSLWGWTELRGATLTTLAANGYHSYSRWSETGGMPGPSELHISCADTVYGLGATEITVNLALEWMIKRRAVPAGKKPKRRRSGFIDDEASDEKPTKSRRATPAGKRSKRRRSEFIDDEASDEKPTKSRRK